MEPLGNGGRALNFQFHQLKLRAAELLFGSKEVAGVRPQGGAVEGDHGRACRTVETTDKLTSLPVVGHVFTLMRVGTGEDKGGQVFAPHHLTQLFQSLCYRIVHNVNLFLDFL